MTNFDDLVNATNDILREMRGMRQQVREINDALVRLSVRIDDLNEDLKRRRDN